MSPSPEGPGGRRKGTTMSEKRWTTAEVRHGYDQVVRDKENNPICTVLVAGWDRKSAQQHARLIAAAPDMYEALKETTAEAERHLQDITGARQDPNLWRPGGPKMEAAYQQERARMEALIDRARAAIAKAGAPK